MGTPHVQHDHLLSPAHAARPLPFTQPAEPVDTTPTPRAYQASDSATNDTFSIDYTRNRRPSASRQRAYELAPIPDQVKYPASPIAVVSPSTESQAETPRGNEPILPLPTARPFSEVAAKAETIGSSSTDAMSTTGLGFLNLKTFGGRRLFRRHT